MKRNKDDLEFIEHLTRTSRYGIILTGVIGLCIFDLYAVLDYLIFPKKILLQIWPIRIGVTGFLIMSLAALATPFGMRHLRSLTLIIALAVSLSVIWIWNLGNPVELPRDISGVTITVLFCMTTLRLHMREAIIYGLLTCGAFFLAVHFRNTPESLLTYYYISLPPVVALGLSVSYLTEMYARKSFLDEKVIQTEKSKTDDLLLKTFPAEIAGQLKSKPEVIAKREDNATVMFCDIVGFTEASAQMSPEDLVQTLNKIFSALDRLTTQHGCEKIKTIGDAYMAVSGVPTPASDHAERVLNLAIEAKALLASFTLNEQPVRVRIGINTGPVVAGVIGENRFAYDLWGDTVNTASRMESLAPRSGIQITESTRLALSDKFDLEKLPPTNVKGKGLMDTWLVLGRKPETSASTKDTTQNAA